MPIPFDMSRCARTEEECVLAKTCLRFLDPGHPTYQSFSIFPGGEDCHAYLSSERTKHG
mgnify:CR=1 FL=1